MRGESSHSRSGGSSYEEDNSRSGGSLDQDENFESNEVFRQWLDATRQAQTENFETNVAQDIDGTEAKHIKEKAYFKNDTR